MGWLQVRFSPFGKYINLAEVVSFEARNRKISLRHPLGCRRPQTIPIACTEALNAQKLVSNNWIRMFRLIDRVVSSVFLDFALKHSILWRISLNWVLIFTNRAKVHCFDRLVGNLFFLWPIILCSIQFSLAFFQRRKIFLLSFGEHFS